MSEIQLTFIGLNRFSAELVCFFVEGILNAEEDDGDLTIYGDELAVFLGYLVGRLQQLDKDGDWCRTSHKANRELLKCTMGLRRLAEHIDGIINYVESLPNYVESLPMAPKPPKDLPQDGFYK